MAFSATDAAFEGFRLARRQPLTAVGISILQLAVGLITSVVMIGSGFQQLLKAGAPGAEADPKESLAFISKLLSAEATFIPIILISGLLVAGAVYRGVLRPNDHGWVMGLKLGADELRLFLVSFMKGLLFLGVGLACGVALVILAAIGGIAGGKAGTGIAMLLVVVGYVAMICFMIYLAVRLSLSGPATVADQKFRLLSTWGMTKGRFWPLLGCYLLAFVLYALVGIIVYAVTAIVVFALSGFHFDVVSKELFQPDFSSMAAFFTPMRFVILVVQSLIAGVLQMVIVAPVAEAYRQLTGTGAADTFS